MLDPEEKALLKHLISKMESLESEIREMKGTRKSLSFPSEEGEEAGQEKDPRAEEERIKEIRDSFHFGEIVLYALRKNLIRSSPGGERESSPAPKVKE